MNAHLPSPSDPRHNHLLGTLPDATWHSWLPRLELVQLSLGQVLCESGSTPAFVYFPTTVVVSLVYLTREGGTAEIAVIGNDGVVGISFFMGGTANLGQAVVQSAGEAYRLPASIAIAEVNRGGMVLGVLLRYTQSLIAQVAQTAACNRYHSIDQQLARRLLLGLDRSGRDELVMTQELAANLLGVRREGITAAARKLQLEGVIRYSRGRIAVLDRERLEQRTCECYAAGRREYAHVLPQLARQAAQETHETTHETTQERTQASPIATTPMSLAA